MQRSALLSILGKALILLALLGAACAGDTDVDVVTGETGTQVPVTEETTRARAAPLYDPTEAGEPLPERYREYLPRDAILLIHEPTSTDADGNRPGYVDPDRGRD